MKTTNIFKLLTPLIMGLIILSLFSGTVYAQTPGQQYEKIREQYQTTRDNYNNTRNQFEDARELFEEANRKFINAAGNRTKEELQIELKEKARQYVLRAINFTQSHLQMMKNKVNIPENKGIVASDAIKIIDAHLNELDDLKTKVSQATTIQEIRDAHKELKKMVVRINLETRYFMGMVLNQRIENFTIKAENVSEKLDAAIEKVKANGSDTRKLVEQADEFKKNLKEAKEIQADTLALFEIHSGFDANGSVIDEKNAREFLGKANDLQRKNIKALKEAGKDLIDFGKEFRKLAGGKVKVSEKGELEVNGEASENSTDR